MLGFSNYTIIPISRWEVSREDEENVYGSVIRALSRTRTHSRKFETKSQQVMRNAFRSAFVIQIGNNASAEAMSQFLSDVGRICIKSQRKPLVAIMLTSVGNGSNRDCNDEKIFAAMKAIDCMFSLPAMKHGTIYSQRNHEMM